LQRLAGSPELLFDANFGELFIVRAAGNVVSAEVMGSLQYAGSHLHTPLFVVLGHQGCGAVAAALDTKAHGTEHKSRIQIRVDGIQPGLSDQIPIFPPKRNLKKRWKRTFAGPSANCSLRRKERAP
jgi:carbonic anhydrase